MTCAKIRFAIQSYVDGAASPGEREAVEAHVAHCAACAQELATTRQLVGLLGTSPARRVSEEFDRNLHAALRGAQQAAPGAAWWERFRLQFEWRLRVPAMVAASSLAVGILAAVVTPGYQRYQEQAEQRERLVSSAIQRHQQLEQAAPNSNWEAVDGSIELTTGSVVVE